MTKVIFRVQNVRGEEPEVIALFPELPGTNCWLQDCLSYQHVGQHGSASFSYYYESTRPATPDEYKDLLAELVSIGYDDLQICSRMTPQDTQKRKEAVLYEKLS